MSGVICGRKIASKVNGLKVIRPAMMYGLEIVALTKKQEEDLQVLRFSLGVNRMDMLRNEYCMRGTTQSVLETKLEMQG